MHFWDELKERKLVQWALAYIAVGLTVLEIVNAVETPFGLSNALVRVILVLVVMGFAVTLVLAWFHGERGHQRVTVPELVLLLAIAGVGAASASLAGRPESMDAPVRTAASGWKAPQSVPEHNSIAVLPFENLSGDRRDDYFSDGITEELTNALGELPGLRVASRTSASQFKSQRRDVREVGSSLAVASVLEGSIQHAGNRIRITARLVDASTGYQLWSDRIDADAGDIFAAEDKISRSVAQALQVKLALARVPTENARAADPAAHQSYLKGRYLASQNDPAAATQAVQQYRDAARRDPGFAPAHAGLAAGFLDLGRWGKMPEAAARDSARMAALRAWQIDSTLPQVHIILSRVAGDLHVRVRELERAVALNPNLPDAKMELAAAQAALGQTREAMAQAREAVRLDPLGARSRTSYREVMVLAGHPDEAMPAPPEPPVPGAPPVATTVAGVPQPADLAMMHANLCADLAANPWAARAQERVTAECLRARALAAGDPRVLGRVALGYARMGRQGDALAALDAYQRVAEGDPRRPLTLAAVYGALGDLDRAFGALANVEPQQLREYLRDPALAPLRLDARFPQLERRATG